MTAIHTTARPPAAEQSPERATERIRLFHARHRALQAGVALVLAGLALAIVTATTMPKPLQQPIDDTWLRWMVGLRAAPLTALARGMSVIGGPVVTTPVRVIIGAPSTPMKSPRSTLRQSSY